MIEKYKNPKSDSSVIMTVRNGAAYLREAISSGFDWQPRTKMTENSNPFTHGEVMFRRDIYKKVGGYRPFFKFAQDRDLWLRMAIQCHHDRVQNRKDLIDQYDFLAGLFRAPSPVVTDVFAKLAIKELLSRSLEKAESMLKTVPEVLYEQRHFSDGVAMSATKLKARYIINAVRIENEKKFRKTGTDYINEYGAGAFAVLSGRLRVQKARLMVRLGLVELALKLGANGMKEIPKVLMKRMTIRDRANG